MDENPKGNSCGECPLEVSAHPNFSFNWVDITEEFKKCSQDLQLGELLHDETFGLFEAMSAIEMMDPKMDTGLLCNRGTKKVLNFDDSVAKGVLKLKDFKEEELIGIIDSTLSCLVCWLDGHSLAQTIFTNLYMHKPYEIKDRTLKIFCITVYKMIDCVKDFILTAGVFEEEDFQVVSYGYNLLPNMPEQKLLSILKEIEDELYKKTRYREPNLVKNHYHNNPEKALALYVRIKATRTFYYLLLQLRRDDTYNDILRTIFHLSECFDIIRKSSHMGEEYSKMGFEPLVNQRLLPPTFPRYTKIKPCNDACKFFEDILDRIKFAVKINLTNSLHNTIEFFIEFSRSRPCILSRSILQVLYFGDTPAGQSVTVLSNIQFIDVLKEACKSFVSPPSLCTVNKSIDRATIKERDCIVNRFFEHCVRPFMSMIQLYGHNHARQREKLAALLNDFASLQDEAERVDSFLHNHYLASKANRPHLACYSTWVLYHILQVMIMYLLSGFELELYSAYEYYYVYWYMYEFLYTWLISALNRAESHITWQCDPYENGAGSINSGVSNNKSRQNKKSKLKKKKQLTKPYEKEIIYYQCLQNICGGFYKGLYGLKLDGLIKLPCNQFCKEPVRFEHRFAPFRNLITPPPVSYKEFAKITDMLQHKLVDTKTLYRTASDHFFQARLAIENMIANNYYEKETSSLEKVVKWNFVVFKILAGEHKYLKTRLEYDFSEHNIFPMIKLQS